MSGDRCHPVRGAKDARLIEEPMAAAIGAGAAGSGSNGEHDRGCGGGTTEVAVISLGGIVSHRSIRVGGDEMDEAIVQHIRRTYNLLVGERTAELVKQTIGSAWSSDEKHMEVRGRDLLTGLPKTILISSVEVKEALAEPISAIVEAVKVTLERTPRNCPPISWTKALFWPAAAASLAGLDRLLANETGMPVHLAEDPLGVVAIGTGAPWSTLTCWDGSCSAPGS